MCVLFYFILLFFIWLKRSQAATIMSSDTAKNVSKSQCLIKEWYLKCKKCQLLKQLWEEATRKKYEKLVTKSVAINRTCIKLWSEVYFRVLFGFKFKIKVCGFWLGMTHSIPVVWWPYSIHTPVSGILVYFIYMHRTHMPVKELFHCGIWLMYRQFCVY